MKCPLRKIELKKNTQSTIYVGTIFEECLQDQCAWWIQHKRGVGGENRGCSIQIIAIEQTRSRM